jgi:rubrerythrin
MPSSAEPTRREALRRGLLAGGAVGAAAVLPGLVAETAFAQEEAAADSDLEILLSLIGFEQSSVVSYGTIAPLLENEAAAAKYFAGQEQEHVDALLAELATIGGDPPDPPKVEDVAGLTEVTTREAALDFAVGVENQAIAAYFDALKSFENPTLQEAAGRIIGVEGQHLTVWWQTLGVNPVPSSFPEGIEEPKPLKPKP